MVKMKLILNVVGSLFLYAACYSLTGGSSWRAFALEAAFAVAILCMTRASMYTVLEDYSSALVLWLVKIGLIEKKNE